MSWDLYLEGRGITEVSNIFSKAWIFEAALLKSKECILYCLVQNVQNVLCQSQTFCVTSKDDCHSENLVFVLAQNFLKMH